MIYIRDEDIRVFEEAQRLGGESLSTVIAMALKAYIAQEKMRQNGFVPIVLTIGEHLTDGGGRHYRKIRFTGRLVAGVPVATRDEIWRRFDQGTRWQLYVTPKQAWVAVLERWEHNDSEPISGFEDLYQDCFWSREFWTAQSVKELQALMDDTGNPLIPSATIEEALRTLGQEFIEDLDI